MEIRQRAALVGLCLGLAAGFGACEAPETDDVEPDTTTVEEEEGAADTADIGAASTGRTGAAAEEVGLSEYEIQMEESLTAGTMTFRVTNSGSVEHNFEVEGEGIERSLPENLAPGESATLRADLTPGTYTVYCPVDDHAERGMSREVDVAERDPGQASPNPTRA